MSNITIPPTGTGTATPVIEAATGPAGANRQVVTIGDLAGNAVDSIGGLTETAPATDTASSGLNGRLQRMAQRFTALIALFPTTLTKAGAFKVGGTTVNPTSTLTRPANTTAYSANDVIASNVTAGSIVVPSFTATPATGGSGRITGVNLVTNATSGWGSTAFLVEFWDTAPTFSGGDNAAYAVATGSAGWLGSASITLTQVGDGAYGASVPNNGGVIDFALTGQTIFWSLSIISGAGATPISGQTFALTPSILQD